MNRGGPLARQLSINRFALTAVLAGLVIASCASGPETDTVPGEPLDTSPPELLADSPNEISRLADGGHLGVSAFSPPSSVARDAWQLRSDEAHDVADVGRVLIDWTEIEPQRGEYVTDALEEQLSERAEFGQTTMVTIAAVDVSGTPFPEWLDGFSPDTTADAYIAMLDHIAPLLERYGVWLLAVANEPPFDDGLDRAEFADFVGRVNDHADDLIPGIPVTFVFAGNDALGNDADSVALRDAVDVLALNHYCLDDDLTVTPLDQTKEKIDAVVAAAAGLEVVFQEFGCPASPLVGSSDDFQAEWFERAFSAIEDEPTVRAAFVFELQDWSQETLDLNYGRGIR